MRDENLRRQIKARRRRKSKRRKRRKNRKVQLLVELLEWGSDAGMQRHVVETRLKANGRVNLTLDINPRDVEYLLIQPFRRPMDDSEGIILDAEKLANE